MLVKGIIFSRLGINSLTNIYFVWGLYFDALCEKMYLSEGIMKTYIMLVITLTLVNLASRSETILKAFDLP